MLSIAHSKGNLISDSDTVVLSMHLTSAPLQKAFTLIKQQSPYRVIYDNSILKSARSVTIDVRKEPLTHVLDMLFENQPFGYKIIDQTIIVIPAPKKNETNDTRTPVEPVRDTLIQGQVLGDSSLTPLAGATITIKGLNKYVVTDEEGRFKITVPSNQETITVSYVGYQAKDIQLKNHKGSVFEIVLNRLPSSMQAITIVTNGYESFPKERATGSFTQVDNRSINMQVGPNIINRLEGITNSVYFDKNPNHPPIMIRGLSTIEGNASPLIVVDNFPYEGDINNINPNDIESITILKDAAAASIWGTKAGNGVIVIKTKEAKLNQPLSIEFNSNISISEKPNLNYAKQMSSSDFIDAEQFLFSQGYYDSKLTDPNMPGVTPVIELLNEERNGTISPEDANKQINALRTIDVRNDFSKYLYQNALQQQYFMGLSGGTTKMTYNLSGGYDHNTDELDAKYSRVSFRAQNTFNLLKNLQLATSINFQQSNSKSGAPAYGSIFLGSSQLYPYAQFADANGNPLPLDIYRQPYTDTAGGGKLLDWKYYPLNDYKHNYTTSSLQDILANIGLQYQIIKGLSINLKYQYEKQLTDQTNIQDEQSFSDRDLINRFTQIDPGTGSITYIVPVGETLLKSFSRLESYDARGQLNYTGSFGPHQIIALGGAEIRQAQNDNNTYQSYGYDDNLGTIGVVDLANSYPTYITGYYSTIPNQNSTGQTINRFTSFFGNGAYIFRNKYTLSGSVRKDASNLFGVNSNKKGVPLWSAGASWDISKESFYKLAALPYLKLRATYGFAGNVDNAMSAVTTLVIFPNAQYTNYTYSNVNQYPNPDLKWERVKIVNIGLDFASKN